MEQAQYDSSTEELSPEELRMLASTKRQEPQGEEHGSGSGTKSSCMHSTKQPTPVSAQLESGMDNMISSGSSSSSPYSSEAEDNGGGGGLEERRTPTRHNPQRHQQHRKGKKSHQQQHYYPRGKQPTNPNNVSTDSNNSHSAYNTLIIHQNNSSLLADTWIPATHEFTSYGIGNRTARMDEGEEEFGSQSQQSVRPTHSYSNPYENFTMEDESGNNNALTSSELSEIPRDYLNKLTVLKHLAKEVKQDPNGGTTGTSLLRSASFSKSQPDLTQSGQYGSRVLPAAEDGNYAKSQPPPGPSRKSKKHNSNNGGGMDSSKTAPCQSQNQAVPQQQRQQHQQHHDDVLPSVQILEILMRENAALNADLVNARRKIATIHKLESELDRLQASHEALFASAERRESLERTARAKLNTELKRLTAVNRELLSSGSLQNLSPSPYNFSSPDIELLKKEIAKRDYTIVQLLAQNKDLAASKERQDIELSAQRATLAEQRTHIDILDSALTNAQANVLRLEEECRKKQEFVDKSSQLQRALSSLQLTNDKREQSEKKVRTALEGEITDLKLRLTSLNVNQSTQLSQHQHPSSSSSPGCPGNLARNAAGVQQGPRSYQSPPYTPPKYESNTNLTESQLQLLQEKLKVSEEQIYHLNSQVAKWENVFSPPIGGYKQQQQPMRVGASASTPDTPNSWTNSNSRGGTPHFFGGGTNSEKVSMEELHQGGGGGSTQPRSHNNDLEWKIKDLESRLMEKDAVIRILQTVPPSSPSPAMYSSMLNSSNSSSSAGGGGMLHPTSSSLPSYRDSPGYSQASTLAMSPCHPQHLIASMMGGDPSSASLLYSKGLLMNQKCESEPPSYANLPLKLRLGGSGSSLVKNSNESLQLGGGGGGGGSGSTGGNSPNISGPGSVSSTSGASGTGGTHAKSIDDQLKELDNQLLSKDGGTGGSGGGSSGGGTGSLKMQSGLCCIPGFAHSSSATRKGKISQSLLESLAAGTAGIGTLALASLAQASSPLSPTGTGYVRKSSLTSSASILPPKPPSTYQSQSQGGGGGARTSSGPPFILSPSNQSPMLTPLVTTTTAMSLSNSADFVLTDPSTTSGSNKKDVLAGEAAMASACNVFTPAVGVPKGLPPKPTSGEAGKSRSLERNKYVNPGDACTGGKYTAVMYDGARCRSLDRRELKLSMTNTGKSAPPEDPPKVEKEKETKNLKSSVSSKAAFFGQLLTRRSPSPAREKEKKDKESSTPKLGRRFPFGSSKSQSQPSSSSSSSGGGGGGGEVAEERMMLDKQGRQSQRNRISSKWSSCNTLEAVEEQSGSESPWTCRKSKGSPKVSKKGPKEKDHQGTTSTTTTSQREQHRDKDDSAAESSSNKTWGRIVKSPFGLRYTFGSPRVAAPADPHPPSSSKQQEK